MINWFKILIDKILEGKNSKIDYVFLLDVPKETLLARITGRRLCKSCGNIYNVNIESLKPKNELICDNCQGELIQRKDDNTETFEVRYNEYKTLTEPLVEFYRNKNVLYDIEATGTVEETFNNIKNIIN